MERETKTALFMSRAVSDAPLRVGVARSWHSTPRPHAQQLADKRVPNRPAGELLHIVAHKRAHHGRSKASRATIEPFLASGSVSHNLIDRRCELTMRRQRSAIGRPTSLA